MGKAIREATADARLLYQRLAEMNIGDTITYEELSKVVSADVQTKARGYLDTARRMAERENEKVFGVIHNTGLKCLTSSEIINTAAFSIGHIHRTTNRTIRKIGCISDLDKLPNEEKIRLNTYASAIGAMSVMTKGNSIKKLCASVTATQEQLPYAKTLDAFK